MNGRSHLQPPDDQALLLRFTSAGCHLAFEELVGRHAQWVGALIRRKIKDNHLAEDVTQAVFIILARKADTIRPDAPLAPWLFRVARFAIRDSMKHELRRQVRWNRVAEMQAAGKNGYSQPKTDDASVDLDDAIACLSETDRQAILLRFYEDMSMAEVGVAMGIGEVAAKKRVSRALKRLRTILDRNGAKVGSILVLATMLRGMAKGTTAHAAVAPVHAAAPSLQLANATMRSISGAHARIRTAMAGGVLAAAVAIGILSPAMGQGVVPLFLQAKNAFANVVSRFSPISLAQSVTTPTIQPNQHAQVPVARLWVGNANDRGWPILPLGTPSNVLPFRSLSGSNDPVAVVQDDAGNYWYRRVDPQAMPDFVATRSLFDDLDLSIPPVSNTHANPSLLDMTMDFFQAADIVAKVDGKDWKQINGPGSDGHVVLPYAGISPDLSGLNPTIAEVPEPVALASILSLAAPLLLHRRRRVYT